MPEPTAPRGASVPAVVAVVLMVLLLWVSAALVRVENQRYAMFTGMCQVDHANPKPFWDCLERVETRTGWWWHLFYALTAK